MEYTDYDTRLAAYGVVTDGDRVLLARLRVPEAGTWTLPGGGVEFDETVEQAVVREIHEETGTTPSAAPCSGSGTTSCRRSVGSTTPGVR